MLPSRQIDIALDAPCFAHSRIYSLPCFIFLPILYFTDAIDLIDVY